MSTVDWVVMVLLWGATVWRLPAAVRDYKQRMLWGAFCGLAISRVFTAGPVVTWMDRVTGGEWATLGRHISGLLSATFLLAFVEIITRNGWRSRVRWIWPLATLVIGYLVTMFLVRGARIYTVPGHPGETATAGRIYLLGFDTWLIYCLGAAAVMFLAYAFTPKARGLLKAGLIISAVGMASGVLNRGEVMVVNVATLLNPHTGLAENDIFGKATLALTVVGITLGTSLPAVNGLLVWWQRRAALRGLEPLWAALVDRFPEIRLDVQGSATTRLFRRVVEINDGMLRLTAWATPPDDGDPARVATWVADTLAVADGTPSGPPVGKVPGAPAGEDSSTVDADDRLVIETEWLCKVAAEFKQSTAARPAGR